MDVYRECDLLIDPSKEILEHDDYAIFNGHRRFSKEYQYLKGILAGIKSDGELADKEISELSKWCVGNEEFINYHPFRELIPLILSSIDDGVLTLEEIADIIWLIDTIERDDIIGDLRTQALNYLHGTIHGILSDGELRDEEIEFLNEWISFNSFLKGMYPYDEIESVLVAILADHKVSEDERNVLMALISNFVDVTQTTIDSREKFKELRDHYSVCGICSANVDIELEGKMFCFTGESEKHKRKEIAEIIRNNGGRYHDKVTDDTDYLIVGNNGNKCWAYSCYGRKVEMAHNMRKAGHRIQLINEIDFWDIL